MPSHNGVTVADVQKLQEMLSGGITTWEYEVLRACRSVVQHGHGEFSFKVQDGQWVVSETTKMRNGKI